MGTVHSLLVIHTEENVLIVLLGIKDNTWAFLLSTKFVVGFGEKTVLSVHGGSLIREE